MHDGIIRSDARMTYTAVNAILTERDPETIAEVPRLVPMFELMGELFKILNERRRRRGSVDFDLPEAQVVLDEEGFIEDIVASERNVAHRLIEEFMLLANETVAGHLEDQGMPALYRIHETPDPLKVDAVRGVRQRVRLHAGRAGQRRCQPHALPEARREDPRQSRPSGRSRS